MTGLIGAMDSEVDILISKLENKEEIKRGSILFYKGTLCGKDVVVAKCGIGKVCSAICAQTMIDLFNVDVIINTGVAGGLAHGIKVGDIVISDALVQHDFDLSLFGYAKGYLPCSGQKDKSVPTRFIPDAETVEKLKQAACNAGVEYIGGTIVSGDFFISDSALKNELITRFGADAAEMEGAAIAQTAYLSGVPFAVVRAISDSADEEAVVISNEFEFKAAEVSSRIILEYLKIA